MAHHTFAQRTELTLSMVVISSFLPSQEQEGKDPLLPAANLPKSQSSIAWYNHRPNTTLSLAPHLAGIESHA